MTQRLAVRLLGRLGGMLLVIWGAATAGFIALRLIPGDPVDVMLGINARVAESVRDQIRADWGLDQPVIVQYFAYLGQLVTGQLESYQLRQPVAEVIGRQALPTLQLTGLALLFVLFLATIAAFVARGRRSKSLVSLVELVVVSSPTFWIGLVLLAVFGFGLGWFPVAASEGIASLILPALTLALPVAGIISQVLRQGLDAAAEQPFATTARARGVGHGRLVRRHTLRHAAGDTITLTGYLIGTLLGGAVLVETVFARPGLGGVAVRAILGRDIPVVLGIIVLAAIVFAVTNLIVDLLHERLDPRLLTVPV
ncbi:ABC transporter permease [Diaminobutyricimonas sp. LJ205]|uniref:ABC transporter permease n=1 Tax=Diaminobutyricimonas sp. LJ205 TaxID=2683590 RepID=UPI0012F501ED|nr:ABC transporter permease [Diaminobutyricimonas sp. LJ205]